ncbi:hypothetical protein IE81DRAFT_254625 [Ceraceosorus guamensis]|uniref:Uncharacterized protein n=1 Tax=Ceraceosorus guamensis TaxID=1522189 RepID=A0A316W7S9_9BASI|nr:hypothetical protein IE81DRAFT_254625 [Ceraceosorus guamensis]PWN44781.1 hypothetical protein IE81DRAFT_254625 [Ceraceosorus guamensis]
MGVICSVLLFGSADFCRLSMNASAGSLLSSTPLGGSKRFFQGKHLQESATGNHFAVMHRESRPTLTTPTPRSAAGSISLTRLPRKGSRESKSSITTTRMLTSCVEGERRLR